MKTEKISLRVNDDQGEFTGRVIRCSTKTDLYTCPKLQAGETITFSEQSFQLLGETYPFLEVVRWAVTKWYNQYFVTEETARRLEKQLRENGWYGLTILL